MMTEATWVLATDTDPALSAAIGPENIFDWRIDVGDELTPIGEVKLQNVTVRNLAAFMIGTGFPVIVSETPHGTWTMSVDETTNTAIIKWDDGDWHIIPLD
ncbi:MAG: hypothetical protein JXO22_03140 [Phycisphaerae bacterium]|nr:hypothetical protein [Phycisphaerae bacterium]